MKLAEKRRLTAIVCEAVSRIDPKHLQIRTRAQQIASKYSPTNAEHFRELSEMVWWLIAVDSPADAMELLNALCEVDDEYYWMFHALASCYATRAWLHSRQKNATAALTDARKSLQWIYRDPNAKAITEREVKESIKRFGVWLERAATESPMRALQVLTHAMRVLVMYQQFAKAGDPAAKSVASRDFKTSLDKGVRSLKQRIDVWQKST